MIVLQRGKRCKACAAAVHQPTRATLLMDLHTELAVGASPCEADVVRNLLHGIHDTRVNERRCLALVHADDVLGDRFVSASDARGTRLCTMRRRLRSAWRCRAGGREHALLVVLLIQDDEKEVEAAHDGGTDVNVLAQRARCVVAACTCSGGKRAVMTSPVARDVPQALRTARGRTINWVRSSKDGGSSVQRGLQASLCDRNCLLLHGLQRRAW